MTPPNTELEVLSHLPETAVTSTPLLFVHGAFAGAWCWEEQFLPYFAGAGHAAHALSLSGHGRSRGRERLDHLSIADYVADLREVVLRLPAPPLLIGHSMGGYVVQKYLEQFDAPGAALLCTVPPQGLMSATLGMLFSRPTLLVEINNLLGGGQTSLDTLKDALFAQPVDADQLQRFYRLCQTESQRAIWDMSLFDLPRTAKILGHLPRDAAGRPRLLVLGAELDHLMAPSTAHMTARSYGVEAEILPGIGHGMMLERDWRRGADRLLNWIQEQTS
ncbi:alpha/beta hydrolase [Denitratisoma oestradiolicum]|uniref:Alpha/beta hydrolase n=1 Tax=Denitratisoma oestradiolicum TaxID=311182 RepID=A0A6S6Y0S5_9PROT|nr:alpha/beta fold hydrolase [Denitratisoma oestradiolicum]TWO80781.1 alpha/beta hydrolase [Denitratisoma oestradiolicum]CAB1370903.1 Alpha/beta hydrolase [Denitratisoma oestradiolicum]